MRSWRAESRLVTRHDTAMRPSNSLAPRTAQSVLGTIGDTPLIRLERFGTGFRPTLYAKFEALNPGGSSKDRAALKMIEAAERENGLRRGSEIIVSTSGPM